MNAARLLGTWRVDDAESLGHVRDQVNTALDGMPAEGCCRMAAEQLPDIVLIASELATNALRHAGSSALVELWCDERGLVVSVMDHRPDAPPVLSVDRDLGKGGFGLQLALRIADDVGWYRTAGDEKHVWARFKPAGADRPVRHVATARHHRRAEPPAIA